MNVLATTSTATQGANNPPDNTLTATSAASNSASSPQDGLHVSSGTAAPLPEEEEGQTEMLSTEKALDDADQAVNSMRSAVGIAITAANFTTTTSDAIDNVGSVYKTWEKAVGTLEAVMVVVDKIAEVIVNCLLMIRLNVLCQIHPYARMAWSVLSLIPKVCPLTDSQDRVLICSSGYSRPGGARQEHQNTTARHT